jgi:nucleotidyltransferase/DNA polymerase involved in DNA repair
MYLTSGSVSTSLNASKISSLLDKPKTRNNAVTGIGGGCVITANYEARKYNINIGTTIWEAKKICPQAVIVPSNFKRYLLYNRNFLNIIRQFTPDVEEAVFGTTICL